MQTPPTSSSSHLLPPWMLQQDAPPSLLQSPIQPLMAQPGGGVLTRGPPIAPPSTEILCHFLAIFGDISPPLPFSHFRAPISRFQYSQQQKTNQKMKPRNPMKYENMKKSKIYFKQKKKEKHTITKKRIVTAPGLGYEAFDGRQRN